VAVQLLTPAGQKVASVYLPEGRGPECLSGNMKFSRQSRLLKPAEFKAVFQEPIRSGDQFFRVLARENGLQHHRLGLAVSRKNCARAVDRNRIKRIVRENFRRKISSQVVDEKLDFVVMPTSTAAKQDNNVLNKSLSAHWPRLTRKSGERDTRHRQDKPRTQG
jgi:ribonuclease P protein component